MNPRSVMAVLAGFMATFFLSLIADGICHLTGIFPPMDVRMSDSLFLFAASYRAFFTGVGGYVTAQAAPDKPMKHAAVLAGIGTLMGTLGLVATWNQMPAIGPVWYAVSIPLSAIPCVMGGAWLRTRRDAGPAGAV